MTFTTQIRIAEVFRSVSHTASCDLLALRAGRIYRVEVKSADIDSNGLPTCRFGVDPARYDILALVTPAQNVHYIPRDASVGQELVGSLLKTDCGLGNCSGVKHLPSRNKADIVNHDNGLDIPDSAPS